MGRRHNTNVTVEMTEPTEPGELESLLDEDLGAKWDELSPSKTKATAFNFYVDEGLSTAEELVAPLEDYEKVASVSVGTGG